MPYGKRFQVFIHDEHQIGMFYVTMEQINQNRGVMMGSMYMETLQRLAEEIGQLPLYQSMYFTPNPAENKDSKGIIVRDI